MTFFDGILIVSLLILYWAVWAAFRTIEVQGASIDLLIEKVLELQEKVAILTKQAAQRKESK